MNTKNELYEIADEMVEMIGEKSLLENLMVAMSYDELKDKLEYIDRMHDLDLF